MKKYILPLAGLALVVIGLAACSGNASNKTAADSITRTAAVIYTCKMHPEVISNKPGKCPKCGMDLIKKEDLKKDSTIH